MAKLKLKLVHLYPLFLNIYGDIGNVKVLKNRCEWRGIELDIQQFNIGDKLDFGTDIFFIGGGQDFEQQVLLEDLHQGKDNEIRSAIQDGLPFLTICGGYQLLGAYYETYDGHRCDFIGAIDFYTVGSARRMIGNYSFQCGDHSGGSTVIGFENHSGKTWLGKSVQPLGQVLKGCGNNGEDGSEGVRYLNVFGTYSHGPLLPKNPELCDIILRGKKIANDNELLIAVQFEKNNIVISNDKNKKLSVCSLTGKTG